MQWQTSSIPSIDHQKISFYRWPSPTNPRALLHITHGMAEHSARYTELARYLTKHNFAVSAHDHPGHGPAAAGSHLGHFADQNGWQRVCDDLGRALDHSAQQHPELPLYLLGHSMGSYASLGYLMRKPVTLAGCVLSGSNYGSPSLYRIAKAVARFEKMRLGIASPSKVMDQLGFGAFNRQFKPNRTDFDWLSRDPAEVDKYIADPLCGFACSGQLWIDLLGGLLEITTPSRLAKVPDIPLYIIGGDCDPVSSPKGLPDLAKALQTTAKHDVTLKLYPHARHELFNETNREEVFDELLNWLLLTPAMAPSSNQQSTVASDPL